MERVNPMVKCALALFYFIGFFLSPFCSASNRIVVLNPMVAEWSAEILGRERALQDIVGASEYSNYPAYMKSIPTIGPYPQIQVEKVLSLRPDLVIASMEYNRPDQIEKLKKLKLKVEVLPRENFHKMEDWIAELGRMLREVSSAKKVADDWKKSLNEIKAPKVTQKAFFEIQFQPLITVGRDSFLNEAFQLAGYENVFGTIPQAYPKVSREAVFAKKPQVVFVFEMVKEKEDLEAIRLAWKNSRVQFLNGDDFSRCSPRLLKAIKGMVKHE